MTGVQPYYEDDHVTLYHAECEKVSDVWAHAYTPHECDDGPPAVLVTDPPYGMRFRSGMGGAFGDSAIDGDDDTEIRDVALALWGDRPALVFGRWSVTRPAGTRAVLTWEKGNHVGMGDLALPWKPNTEEIYVLGSGFVGHRGSSVLRYLAVAGTVGQAAKGTRWHPTEKPVGLLHDLINKCPPSAVIVDPFAGSGTTLRAAKDLGRRAVGVERKLEYCEAAVARLAQEVLDFG